MCGVAGAYQQPDGKLARHHHGRAPRPSGARRRGLLELVAPTTAASLAHRRLSIIDLSTAADQPLVKDGLHSQLQRRALQLPRAARPSRAAGRPVRHEVGHGGRAGGWRAWGPAALPRFRGMFAFAIHDAGTAALTLARDPLGIKPLYVMRRGSGIVFASELKAIMAALGPELTVDPAGWWRPPCSTACPRNSRPSRGPQAPAGVMGRVATRRHHVERALLGRRPRRPLAAAAGPRADLAAVLEESVAAHMVADVPVASFLSGGLDSSLVTAIAATATPPSRHTPSRSVPRTSVSRRCPTTPSTPGRWRHTSASGCTRSRSARTS